MPNLKEMREDVRARLVANIGVNSEKFVVLLDSLVSRMDIHQATSEDN
jgi:hypothetical protein